MRSYLARDDDLGGPRAVKDTNSIGSAYDRYLQNGKQVSSDTMVGVALTRPVSGGMADHSMIGRPGAVASDLISGRNIRLAQLPVDAMPRLAPGRETAPLPPDATNTLYIEGLPPDSMRREVAHIFRPFVGYKEVRLVSKESKLRGGDPLILCFVDFVNPACAATAMSALQELQKIKYGGAFGTVSGNCFLREVLNDLVLTTKNVLQLRHPILSNHPELSN